MFWTSLCCEKGTQKRKSKHILNKPRLKNDQRCGILGDSFNVSSSNVTVDPIRVVGGGVVPENYIPWQVDA